MCCQVTFQKVCSRPQAMQQYIEAQLMFVLTSRGCAETFVTLAWIKCCVTLL